MAFVTTCIRGDTELNHLATTFIKGPGQNFIDNITTGAGQIKDASAPCPGDPRAVLAGECGPGGFAAAEKPRPRRSQQSWPAVRFCMGRIREWQDVAARRFWHFVRRKSPETALSHPLESTLTIPSTENLNFLDGNPDVNMVYGPVDGGQPTFLGPAPPAQHSGIGSAGNRKYFRMGSRPTHKPRASPRSCSPRVCTIPTSKTGSLGVQRELRRKLMVEAQLRGHCWDETSIRAENVNRVPGGRLPEGTCVTDNLGRRLCSQINTNTAANGLRINPQRKVESQLRTLASLGEHGQFESTTALQVSVRKQMSHGLQFGGNYTYSHSIDSGSTWQSAGSTVRRHRRRRRGRRPTRLSPVWIAAIPSLIFVIASPSPTFGKCLSSEINTECWRPCWVAGNGMASGHSRVAHTGLRSILIQPCSRKMMPRCM